MRVGDGLPVRIMGALNVSPESFYKGSVAVSEHEIGKRARMMLKEGADIIDVGAMSTAPYLETQISLEEEMRRIKRAFRAIRAKNALLSVDTTRAEVANEALEAGARIVNDVSGLKNDSRMAEVVKKHDASLTAMAYSPRRIRNNPVETVVAALRESVEIAIGAGIPKQRIAIDPGIGFYRAKGSGIGFSTQELLPWYRWDCFMLKHLSELRIVGRPICVSVSRKSFIGQILRLKRPEERLAGSLSAAALAVAKGAHIIRTHDVLATLQAVRMAEAIVGASSK